MHRLSEKQFTWVGVRGRALAQAWSDCEALLVGKSWLGGLKAKVRQANFLYSSPLLVLLPSVVEPEPGQFGWSWSRFNGPAPAPQHWVATPKLVKNTKSQMHWVKANKKLNKYNTFFHLLLFLRFNVLTKVTFFSWLMGF